MNNSLNLKAERAGCSIAIKCADDLKIERCISSIDDSSVSINAVIIPSHRIEKLLENYHIPYVTTPFGNIARSAELSVETAEHDNVIIMDSDAYFAPGSITLLRQALETAPVVKPHLEFIDNGSRISKLISDSRRSYNADPTKITNPGLGLRRREIAEKCGYIFNPLVRWTEDADLNYRLHKYNVPIKYVENAVVYHDSVALSHELKCAFLYGVGKRLSIENTPGREAREEFTVLARKLASIQMINLVAKNIRERGPGANMLAIASKILYLAGYHVQKHTGHWTVPE